MRIVGPPGTGKTTYLSKKVEELSIYYHKEEICMTSFTKSAAKVLGNRIEGGKSGTLHSLCYENCSRPTIAESKIADWNEKYPQYQLSLTKKNVDDMAMEEQYSTSADSIMSSIQIKRNKMEEIDYNEKKLFDLWYKWKYDNDLWDFTDLIEHNLYSNLSPPNDPRVLIVDEAQDLTILEAELIKKWSRYVDIFIVAGDSDQCIYSFKGVKPEGFISLDNDFNVLSQSHRVPSTVHNYATGIIGRSKDREDVSYKPKLKTGFVKRQTETYDQDLSFLINKDLQNYKNVMILCTCGYMVDKVRNNLRESEIPFHNPYRTRRGDWNPVRLGSSVGDLLAFYKKDKSSFLSWQRHLKRSCFEKGIKDQLTVLEKDSKKIDYVWNHYVKPELKSNFGNIDWYVENCLSTKRKSLKYPLKLIKKNGSDIEPRVIIGTIHSVKGGEADVVYLFPDISRKSWENQDDSLHRVFYVGATRAKEGLRIMSPLTRFNYDL